MQTFRTRFTTDISQHRRVMAQFRAQTCSAIQEARNSLLQLGAVSIAGYGIKSGAQAILSLAANMEKTKVAFEVMLGGAQKAEAVLGQLVKFADVTPFDTAEVIAAGRQLLACGTATDQLTAKLELLGNIAAGTNMPLNDMVALYAKMANKGKVQAEELNQMAERGIPIYRVLCDMLGVTQNELVKMGENGVLSFALISEALASLGGKGGQYFGLIARQSQTLDGLFSTLQGNVKLLATDFGALIIPQLSEYLNKIIAELDRMKQTGELDAAMKQLADSVMRVMRSIVDLGKWLAENREMLLETGKLILYCTAWGKINQILNQSIGIFRQMSAMKTVDFSSLRQMSGTVKYLTADVQALTRAFGGLHTSLMMITATAGTAFAGWQIGKLLAEAMDLDRVLTRLILKKKGMTDEEINSYLSGQGNQKIQPSVPTLDLSRTDARKKEIQKNVEDLKNSLKNLDQSTPAGARHAGIIQGQIDKLNAEASALDAGVKKYEADVKNAAAREKGVRDQIRANQAKGRDIRKKMETVPQYLHVATGQGMSVRVENPEYKRLQTEDAALRTANGKLFDTLNGIQATKRAYVANKKKQGEAAAAATLEAAKQSSAAEAVRRAKAQADAEAAEAEQKKRDEKEREFARRKRNLKRAREDLADDKARDALSDKIKNWNKEIEKYQKQIDKTEKMLSKFGLSVDENILKSPAEIAQQRKDDLLKKKIEAHNNGEKVTFSPEEKQRIDEMQRRQNAARTDKKKIAANRDNIAKTENESEGLEKKRRARDYRRREEDFSEEEKDQKRSEKEQREAWKKVDAAKNKNAVPGRPAAPPVPVGPQLPGVKTVVDGLPVPDTLSKASRDPKEILLEAIRDALKQGLPNQKV